MVEGEARSLFRLLVDATALALVLALASCRLGYRIAQTNWHWEVYAHSPHSPKGTRPHSHALAALVLRAYSRNVDLLRRLGRVVSVELAETLVVGRALGLGTVLGRGRGDGTGALGG